ncbi:hypothetical protein MQY53_004426 [Salmonella enterica subsp. enterica]|nr:hypothetical protein [Salmonella enterica subsp. enterica]
MWLILLIAFIVIAYLFIKVMPSKQERELHRHALARDEATQRIMLAEKPMQKTPVVGAELGDPTLVKVPQYLPDWVFNKGVRRTAKNILIEYDSGETTKRHVTVIYINSTHIYGYCYLRSDYRTFSFRSVLSAVDTDTGEKLENLRAFLNADAYEEKPTGYPEMATDDGAISVNCNVIIKTKWKRAINTNNINVVSYSHVSAKIFAKCNESGEYRIFYIDNIIEAIDPDSGEIIKGFRSYLRKHKVS